jgi:hypothetical protein
MSGGPAADVALSNRADVPTSEAATPSGLETGGCSNSVSEGRLVHGPTHCLQASLTVVRSTMQVSGFSVCQYPLLAGEIA